MLSLKFSLDPNYTPFLRYSFLRPRMGILSTTFHAVLLFGGPQGPVRVRILDGV